MSVDDTSNKESPLILNVISMIPLVINLSDGCSDRDADSLARKSNMFSVDSILKEQ